MEKSNASWKDNMRILIEGMDFDVWKVVKIVYFFPDINLMMLW